ncbi:MAG: heavy metal-binding domain-containing protein, partial [bacterium]|nr:heavy metal-binding domain-containing protein [bacterium]
MNSKNTIILIIAVFFLGVIIGGTIFYFFLSGDKAAKSTETVASAKSEQQLYSCGMHPNVISEEPGNCPICGMKLTPIKGGASSTSSSSKEKGKILYWRAPM